MKTPDWFFDGVYWRCRWCSEESTQKKDFPHTDDCEHFWDDPPDTEL